MNPSFNNMHNDQSSQPHLADAAWEQLLNNIDLSPVQEQEIFQDWASGGGDTDSSSWPIDLTLGGVKAAVPQSVLSFSEESLTSGYGDGDGDGDDLVFSAPPSNNGSVESASTATESLDGSGFLGSRGMKKEYYSGTGCADDGFMGIAIPFDEEFD